MATDLDLLIDFFQWEIVRIKNNIDENMKMGHYKEVEQDQKAIRDLNQQLDILFEIQNTHYPEIREAERSLNMYERLSNLDRYKNLPEWKDLQKTKIATQRKVIEELKKLNNPNSDETQFVDEAIFSLLSGEHRGFFLHFRVADEKTYLQVEYIKDYIFDLKVCASENTLNWLKQHGATKDLSLKWEGKNGSLHTSFQLPSQRNILPLKEVLAKLILAMRTNFKSLKTMYLEMY